MTFPQIPEAGRRTRWLKIAAGIWLLLISLIAIVHSVGLSRLTEQGRRDTQATQIKALAGQIAELAQQAEADKHQPKPVSQADFAASRQVLETRLASVEQAQADAAHASDLQALQERVDTVEARQQELKSATPTVRRSRAPVATQPKVQTPPFRIVGLELRGGERFLSIASPATTSLANVRLLREGDSDGDWQLQSIDAHAALFLVKGQPQRVALP
ncbi:MULTISPECIES: hypothetical protein [Burkholderiaceae]|jgi:hypothetical protein|uniref:hypothetical protein n=1 Tax=Burkholderiaceae TaxID=119060 RepID=UPI00124825CD|nr:MULTISPECIES: hypothetical protein [Burkholderiaceae]KAB0600212.1 hypothetical protein F7R19_22225 [Cupriavidus pauculus]MBR8163268.1 hypothetical protein [Burkholderia vietnamiensis]MCA7943037.1 hypothetical protein [Burkholderia vietnamiensis]MCA8148808.1 hypothetical protein [Burkholderia vietnamiensis]MCA8193889.1 hypothetical protein [Burkholderia vietnamiensis]